MSAHHLIQYLSWSIFLLLSGIVTAEAIRRPWRVNIDIALLFGAPALIILIGLLVELGSLVDSSPINALVVMLLLAIAYLLLRLVDDFANLQRSLLRGAEIGLLLLSVLTFALPPPHPFWLSIIQLLYLVILLIYVVQAFGRESRRAGGVTRRRMLAAAAGSLLLVLTFLIASLTLIAPAYQASWQLLADTSGLAAGICYFLGFAPPRRLRRAWQEPELRAFLGRAARLPRLPTTAAIVAELERGAAESLGAPGASIGLWQEASEELHFGNERASYSYRPTPREATGQAWLNQKPALRPNVVPTNSALTALDPRHLIYAVLAAPITAGSRRLGVLVVYAPRAPIFADDDLALVQLLADQAAVILESRTLIDEAARMRAREEAARLKDDFLSAAAHDLKTPLTTLVARAQLIERRALRNPQAPADLVGIQTLVREGTRLRRLVTELLDAARAERGLLVGEPDTVDLAALARAVCARHSSPFHPCRVDTPASVIGCYDVVRIEQLLENLIENAVKYSPVGGAVQVNIAIIDGTVQIAVYDQGIGIPQADLPHIFERFYRGANVDDRRFAGMGLGLFICHSIVEQHGGRIWASSQPGQGTTFYVLLPLALTAEVGKVYA